MAASASEWMCLLKDDQKLAVDGQGAKSTSKANQVCKERGLRTRHFRVQCGAALTMSWWMMRLEKATRPLY